mgnify:CR=1 FL=1
MDAGLLDARSCSARIAAYLERLGGAQAGEVLVVGDGAEVTVQGGGQAGRRWVGCPVSRA